MSIPTDQRSGAVRAPHATLAWIVTAVTFGYMLPWAIACTRGSRNSAVVAVVTLFLGWTVIGWFVALAMAFKPHQVAASATVHVYQPQQHQQPQQYQAPQQ